MLPQLQAKLDEVRATRAFNPETWVHDKCEMLNRYMKNSGLKGIVVNVSGGIDSAVTILLAKHAQAMEGSPITRVIGICQPIHSTASIQDRGRILCEKHNIECAVIDQTAVFDLLRPIIDKALNVENPPSFATGQLRSYMRTPPAYYACQLLCSSGTPAIVLGTGNYDEDGYLYYFCKPGDGTSDVQLIHDLHKSEVKAVAKYLNCTEEIVVAPPSADLWEGQTDEDELGFPYSFCELYVELLHTPKSEIDAWVQTLDEENRKQWDEWSKNVENVHRRNKHKEVWPINLDLICPTGKQYSFEGK
ncbi:NAD+ synthetase family protein [Tritrichomonas foetus]|uniref:NAD+ synthetase family protein n=1 Tax=Tritrichomonas foetus TaxID=1144522 RepID=A0A1J4JYE7_9EUKA|nr:NAD+ synthetase family protein [Tritrichomonas foetus]|eukprot:OHT04185.1 NAD+ synthetase family protein [Tritrichomonas foetus]